jgi:hypothetical protein
MRLLCFNSPTDQRASRNQVQQQQTDILVPKVTKILARRPLAMAGSANGFVYDGG